MSKWKKNRLKVFGSSRCQFCSFKERNRKRRGENKLGSFRDNSSFYCTLQTSDTLWKPLVRDDDVSLGLIISGEKMMWLRKNKNSLENQFFFKGCKWGFLNWNSSGNKSMSTRNIFVRFFQQQFLFGIKTRTWVEKLNLFV